VSNLNADEDIARVKAALGSALPTHCFLTLRIGTALLKLGVARGLTLYEIGQLVVRETPDRSSRLEVRGLPLAYHVGSTQARAPRTPRSPSSHHTERSRTHASPRPPAQDVIDEVRAELSAEGGAWSLSAETDHGRFMARLEPALEALMDLVRDRKMIHRSVSS
jgi:hypothetical protein